MKKGWTLEEGIEFVRELDKALKGTGWEVSLGGSVLKKGKSSKDLDVILFPTRVPETRKIVENFKARSKMAFRMRMHCQLTSAEVQVTDTDRLSAGTRAGLEPASLQGCLVNVD